MQSWGHLDPGTNIHIRVRDSSLIFPHLSSLLASWVMLQKQHPTAEYRPALPPITTAKASPWTGSHCPDMRHQDILPPQGSREQQCLFNSNSLSKRLLLVRSRRDTHRPAARGESWCVFTCSAAVAAPPVSGPPHTLSLHSTFCFCLVLTNFITSKVGSFFQVS